MTNYIDDKYLDRLGVMKDAEFRQYMSESIVELLNMRVANRISEILDDSQMRDMLTVSEGRRMSWLENNIPNFNEIVREEMEGLIKDTNAVMPE